MRTGVIPAKAGIQIVVSIRCYVIILHVCK
jgi:hypothetical protein